MGRFAQELRELVDQVIEVRGAELGLYIQFESQPGVPLQLSSLEDARQDIELVAGAVAKRLRT